MAAPPRLFIPRPLRADASLEPADGQLHYLTKVLRLGKEAEILVFNGEDGEWRCLLEGQGKALRLRPVAQTRDQSGTPDLNLAFAPLKKTRTDFVVEKATELGVRCIEPVITRYTQTERVRVDRLHAVAIEAAEQTERLDVPEIQQPVKLAAWLDRFPSGRKLFFCDEAGGGGGTGISGEVTGPATVLIGPEGGFAPEERAQLRAHPAVTAITLGPRILRAETAAIAALTLWQSVLGDWGERPYVPE